MDKKWWTLMAVCAGIVMLLLDVTIVVVAQPAIQEGLHASFTEVQWDGEGKTTFKVEIHVDAWDRHRLLEDLSRTFAETGINILEARCIVSDQMVRNRFVVEVGDTKAIDGAISRLRNIDAVFDAFRVTPSGA